MLTLRAALGLALFVFLPVGAAAQQADPPPPAPVNPPPPANAVAATVNGQPIPELMVYRALQQAPASSRAELRAEVVKFLVENTLVDQYLDQMKIAVDAKELDAQLAKVKKEITDKYKDLDTFYKMLVLTEADLRAQVHQSMRWEKFINQYATEKTLKDFHDSDKAMFDGSTLRARHILAAAKPGETAKLEQGKAKLQAVKKAIEDKVAKGLAEAGKLEPLEEQKKRIKLLEDAFSEAAFKESDCPSKNNGGELGWFPRAGGRVSESFARLAFQSKPFTLGEPASTEYGWHLVLVVDTKPGMERKFDDIKEFVKEIYAERMREAIVTRMRPAAKITVNEAAK